MPDLTPDSFMAEQSANELNPDTFLREQSAAEMDKLSRPQQYFGTQPLMPPALARIPDAPLPTPADAVAGATDRANRFVDVVEQTGQQLRNAAIPHELRGYTPEELAAPGRFINPRTGRRSTVEEDITPMPVLDAPVLGGQQIARGVEQMAEPTLREKAGGASKVIRGGLQATEPLMVGAGVVAPIATAGALAGGTLAQAGTEAGLKKAGVPEEYANLAGDVAGLAGGAAGGVGAHKLTAPLFEPGGRFNPLNPEVLDKERITVQRGLGEAAPKEAPTVDLTPDQFMAEETSKPTAETKSAATETKPLNPDTFMAQSQTTAPEEETNVTEQQPAGPGREAAAAEAAAKEQRPVGVAEPGGKAAKASPQGQNEVSANDSTSQALGMTTTTQVPRGASVPGRETNVPVPGEETTYPARYAVRELADVQPSHNGFSFEPNPAYEHTNDRDYTKAENGERIVRQAGTFDPGYLLNDNPDAVNGPPIIDARGNVLGGNSRAMTLQRVYEQRPEAAQAYREQLAQKAAQFGIKPEDVARMKAPVLVREASNVTNPQQAITDFNKTGTAALSSSERAIADSRRLTPETLDFVGGKIADEGEDATLNGMLGGKDGPAIVQRLVDDGVITPQEKPQYIDHRGIVTPEGKQRITRLMVGRFFDTPAEYEAAPAELRQKLERVVAPLSQVQGRGEWDLMPHVREAVGILTEARQRGLKNLDDLAGQQSMFGGGERNGDALAIAKALQQSPLKAMRAFRQFTQDAAMSSEGQNSFFTPPTREEAFRAAFVDEPPLFAKEIKHAPLDRNRIYTPDEVARDVDWEVLPPTDSRPARLRTNWQGAQVMANAKRHQMFSGMAMPARMSTAYEDAIRQLSDRLFASGGLTAQTHAKLHQFADALMGLRFRSGGRPVIAYNAEHGEPLLMSSIRRHAETQREELIHAEQYKRGFHFNERHDTSIDPQLVPLLTKHPAWPAIERGLDNTGYDNFSRNAKIAEAAAQIGAGKSAHLGISEEQAVSWLKEYRRMVSITHTPEISDEMFRYAAPEIRSKLGIKETPRGISPRPGDTDRSLLRTGGGGEDGAGRDGLARRFGSTGSPDTLHGGPANAGANGGLFDPAEAREVARTAALDKDKLQGQRLTTQINSPLTRDEQRAKLKPSKENPQTNFFEDTTPDQGALFSMLGGLHGPIQRLLSDDVVPTLKDAAVGMTEAADDVLKILAPTLRDVSGQRAAAILRGRLGELARRYDQAEASMRKARQYFSSRTARQNYDFIGRMERGEKQPTQEEQQIADVLRRLLDGRRQQVQDLGGGKLQKFYENYFPHIWQNPKSAKKVFASFFGRRPLEGGKSFLKQRTLPTFEDGLAAGLKPVSDNPIDLVMLKTREMDRYTMAHLALEDMKEQKLAKYIPAIDGHAPAGWMKIDDPIGTLYGPSVQHITEYPNQGLWDTLGKVADALGVKHERGFLDLRGAVGRAARSGTIKTLHGTAEDVIAHEIGHQIDFRAGSGKRFILEYPDVASVERLQRARKALKDTKSSTPEERKEARKELDRLRGVIAQRKQFAAELRALADLRSGDRSYTHKREEKMAQLAEMWVGSRELFERTAPTVFAEWKRFLDETPRLHALRDIEGNTEVLLVSHPYDVGGLVIKGNWWAPEGAARILNNYLTPGLRAKSGLYRALLGANNVLNQFQLGFSAFHLGFTSADAAISRAALGYEQLFRGHPVTSVKTLASTPLAPFTTALKGSKLLQAWFKPGTQGSEMAAIANELMHAGGRVRMDEYYQTRIVDKMAQAWHDGNLIGAVLRLPFATVEAFSKPILEYLVPRQKLGVFLDMARFEMEQHNRRLQEIAADPKLGPDEQQLAKTNAIADMRRTMRQAWDSVENRMGQMTYDNLFWSRSAKDLAMLTVRSVGWNLGTMREVGGGLSDLAKQPLNALQGKPVNLKRITYLLGLVTVGATLGAIYQYLRTGKGPGELKDYFFPKTGETDENGRPLRVSMPTYIKDIYHYAEEPGRTLANKTSPLLNLFADMIRNEDFYGVKIRNEDDPLVKQLFEEARYIGKEFEPLGSRNFRRQSEAEQSALTKAQNFIGITQAPSALEKSKAELLASELVHNRMPAGGRTQEQADRSQLERKITREARLGRPVRDEARQALTSGQLTPRQIAESLKNARLTPIERNFKRLTVEEAFKVYEEATPAERGQLKPLLVKKVADGWKTMPPDQQRPALEGLRHALTLR
jgi:hypothetical protein